MESQRKFDVAEHLPLKDFLAHVMGLSDSLEPKFDEMHEILSKTEAIECEFARRLDDLGSCLSSLASRPSKKRRRQLTRAEKEVLELATIYKSLYQDKERMRAIRDQSSEMVNEEFLQLNPQAAQGLTSQEREELSLARTEEGLREAEKREISSWEPFEQLPNTSDATRRGEPDTK